MAPSLTKLIYKPDSQSTEEYTIIVNQEEFHKYKNGDTSIPIVDIVDSYKVFHSTQGSQGLLGTASKQQLETVFGSSKDVDVVEFMLKNGKEQAADGIQKSTTLNATRGSIVADTRGAHRTTGI